MNVVRGRDRGGRVEVDVPLPEETEVLVLVPHDEDAFELAPEDERELADRSRAAEHGEVEPAERLFARLRAAAPFTRC